MSFDAGCRVVKLRASGGVGTTVVATRDFLPGEIVLEEKEPLMFVPTEMLLKEYIPEDNYDVRLCCASYLTFRKLEPHEKETFLILRYPEKGATEKALRFVGSSFRYQYSFDETEPARQLTRDELDMFVKVSKIVKMNICALEGGKAFFAHFKRFGHSCAANCTFAATDNGIYVRTIAPVSIGDEMTISYNPDRDTEPTHVRRRKYLEGKEFTCHCPRCAAPGDDTRQFDCFDPTCKGVMMVCQPINKEPTSTKQAYTGVAYVNPHLLPCTVCHRTASVTHQKQLLALEAELPSLQERCEKTLEDAKKQFHTQFAPLMDLLAEIESLNLPRRHQKVVPILNIVLEIQGWILIGVMKGYLSRDLEQCRAAVKRAAYEYISAQENITSRVHQSMVHVHHYVCENYIALWRDPWAGGVFVFSTAEAKALLQRQLCLILMHDGREMRPTNIECALLQVFEDTPSLQVHGMEVCAFCEESPLRAAFTLSRCGRCKKVGYCSVGCQKAHWKLHKKSCKGVYAK